MTRFWLPAAFPALFGLRALASLIITVLVLGAPNTRAQTPTQAQTPPSPSSIDPNSITPVVAVSLIPAPTIAARAWVSIDVNSGQVLAALNPHQSVEPASLTKIMTAYLVFSALEEKRLTLDQFVPISERAWRTGGSRMFVEPRKPVTVDALLQGIIVQSGNDASVALAEAVGGSESVFVTLMNQEAARLGMKQSHFVNATGLPNPQHITSVQDLATIATRMITDHPHYFRYYKQKTFTYNKITQSNRNRLLWVDPSIDGLKTGHTESAGYCLIATALRGERRVLTVIVGTDSEATRAEESLKLLNWSFQNFDTVKLFDKGQAALTAPVWEGQTKIAELGPPTPIWLSIPRGKAGDIKPIAERTDPLVAPLEQGQRIGTLRLTLNDKTLRIEPLVVQTAVERAGFFKRMIDLAKRQL